MGMSLLEFTCFTMQVLQLYEDGRRYDGSMVEGKRHGGAFCLNSILAHQWSMSHFIPPPAGIHTWPDGSSYSGLWCNDHKHGSGSFTLASGEVQYAVWKRDKKQGAGWLLGVDGVRREGRWDNDRFVASARGGQVGGGRVKRERPQ